MNTSIRERDETIDRIWETLPPVWNMIRSHIRSEATGRYELTVEQFQILRLVRRGNRSASEVAAARGISRPAVSQGVEILVKRGLLTRTESTTDRRFVELALTQSGNSLLDEVFKKTRAWMKERLSMLTAEEMTTVSEAMVALRKMLA